MTTAYAYIVRIPATVLLASVNSVSSNHIGNYCLFVGYDTVKRALILIAVNHRFISWGTAFRCCQMC